jgi:TonB family protein
MYGDHVFLRSVQYLREGQPGVEINISELIPEPSPDSSQFAPLSGALELTNCLAKEMTPPRAESTPEPDFPKGEHTDRALVVLYLIVGIDGMPHDIQVARSGGTVFDAEAVRAVERWRFKPSTCRGEAVAAQIVIEVDFRR